MGTLGRWWRKVLDSPQSVGPLLLFSVLEKNQEIGGITNFLTSKQVQKGPDGAEGLAKRAAAGLKP